MSVCTCAAHAATHGAAPRGLSSVSVVDWDGLQQHKNQTHPAVPHGFAIMQGKLVRRAGPCICNPCHHAAGTAPPRTWQENNGKDRNLTTFGRQQSSFMPSACTVSANTITLGMDDRLLPMQSAIQSVNQAARQPASQAQLCHYEPHLIKPLHQVRVLMEVLQDASTRGLVNLCTTL